MTRSDERERIPLLVDTHDRVLWIPGIDAGGEARLPRDDELRLPGATLWIGVGR